MYDFIGREEKEMELLGAFGTNAQWIFLVFYKRNVILPPFAVMGRISDGYGWQMMGGRMDVCHQEKQGGLLRDEKVQNGGMVLNFLFKAVELLVHDSGMNPYALK